jgi:hypothetical protein
MTYKLCYHWSIKRWPTYEKYGQNYSYSNSCFLFNFFHIRLKWFWASNNFLCLSHRYFIQWNACYCRTFCDCCVRHDITYCWCGSSIKIQNIYNYSNARNLEFNKKKFKLWNFSMFRKLGLRPKLKKTLKYKMIF